MVCRYPGIPSTYGQFVSQLASVSMSASGTYVNPATPVTGTMASTLAAATASISGTSSLPVSAADITSVVITNTTNITRTNWRVTFGQYFGKGDVIAGSTVGVKISGVAIEADVFHKATHADGSLRFAVITAVLTSLPASGSQTLVIYTKSIPAAGTPISKSSILATPFDASVSLNYGGTTFTITARDLLVGNKPASTDTTWLSGQNCSEFIIGGRIWNGPTSLIHLNAYFHIRAYGTAGVVSRIRCDVVIENGWTFTANSKLEQYIPTVIVNGQTVWNNSGATYNHYHHSRLVVTGWYGSPAAETIAHDRTYLRKSKAVLNFGTNAVNEATIASFNSYTPGGLCDFRNGWNGGGYDRQIGPYPEWDVVYIKTGDTRAYDAVISNGKAAGSFSFHYRDENTGYPPSINTYTQISVSEGSGGLVNGTGGMVTDIGEGSDASSHEPLIGYMAYLLTGDYYYFEELMFRAAYNLFVGSRGDRGYGLGDPTLGIPGSQLRGRVWGIRTIALAAAIAPDDYPLKSYLNSKVNNWINLYVTTGATPGGSDYNTLGAPRDYDYEYGGNKYNTWQVDFFGIIVGMLGELGFNVTTLAQWAHRAQAGRMGQPGIGNGYCSYWGPYYNMDRGLGQTALGNRNYLSNWGQVYADQFPGTPCTPPGPSTVSAGFFQDGAYPTTATAYAANLQCALALAVDSGVSNMEQWRKCTSMHNYITNGNMGENPLWDIEPRVTIPTGIAALAPYQWYKYPVAVRSKAVDVAPCTDGNCNYWLNTGVLAVMRGWSSGALDYRNNKLYVTGGGHNDYAGNEVYSFDLATGQWTLETQPYVLPTAGDYADKYFYSEDPNNIQPSQGHSYGRVQYCDEFRSIVLIGTGTCGQNGSNEGPHGHSIAMLNVSTKKWSKKANQGSNDSMIGAYTAIDAFGNIWLQTTQTDGRLSKYVPSTDTWTVYNNYTNNWFTAGPGCAIDTKRNRMFSIGTDYPSNNQNRYWDLNNPMTAPVTLNNTPSAMNVNAGQGLIYDPIGDRLIGWNGGRTIYIMNCATLTWSTVTCTGIDPGPPTGVGQGVYGRFRYVPAWHGIILATEMDKEPFFLKL